MDRIGREGLFGGVFNVEISGGTFVQVHAVQNSNPESGLFALSQAISHEAMCDSAARYPPGKCHPGTREEVLNQILEWINNPAPDADVLWLYGAAGVGKSAVMQTIAEILRDLYKERYAGSFFFAKGVLGRDQGNALFSTLSYQIAMNIPDMREWVNRSMMADPTLPTKSMDIQMQSLVVTPFLRSSYRPDHSATMIIDGLDECHGPDAQRAILALIANSRISYPLPLRFLIASRPEFWIRDSFNQQPLFNMTRRINLSESPDALDDVKKYLQAGFAEIYARNLDVMSEVKKPWPSSKVIDRLAAEASGQFVHPSTVLKFVGAFSSFCNPQHQLEIICGTGPSRASALSDLDELYIKILAVYPRRESLIRVLGGIVALGSTLSSQQAISYLMNVGHDEMALVLRATSSIVGTSTAELEIEDKELEEIYRSDTKIKFHHLSTWDFLVDSNRSGPFYVNLQETHDFIFSRYLNLSICALNGAQSYDFIYRPQTRYSPLWCNLDTSVTKNTTPAIIKSSIGDLHLAIHQFHISQFTPSHTKVLPGVLLRHIICAKEILKNLVEWKMEKAINIKQSEMIQMIQKIQDIEDYCFHQILSAADFPVFAQIAHFLGSDASLPLGDLRSLPWNNGQLTKEFLVKYVHLIDSNDMYWSRTYDTIPSLKFFFRDPIRAGIFKCYVRKQFIKVIDKALECYQSYMDEVWGDEYEVQFCNRLDHLIWSFFENNSFSDLKSSEDDEDFQHLQNFITLLCRPGSDRIGEFDVGFFASLDFMEWIHRQLNSATSLVLLCKMGPDIPQKLLSIMVRGSRSHILSKFSHPHFLEMWVVNGSQLIRLHFPPLSHYGDQQSCVEEDISISNHQILDNRNVRRQYSTDFDYERSSRLVTNILILETHNLPIDRAQVFTLFLEFYLFFLAKKFYSQLHPDSDSNLNKISLHEASSCTIWFNYAHPTEKVLVGLRALGYMMGSEMQWRPPTGFGVKAMDFLKKYDLHPADRLWFEKWLQEIIQSEASLDDDLDSDSDVDMGSDGEV